MCSGREGRLLGQALVSSGREAAPMEDVREGASAATGRLMVINSSTAAVFGACNLYYLVWVASLCQGLLAQRQFQLYCGGLTVCYWGAQQ